MHLINTPFIWTGVTSPVSSLRIKILSKCASGVPFGINSSVIYINYLQYFFNCFELTWINCFCLTKIDRYRNKLLSVRLLILQIPCSCTYELECFFPRSAKLSRVYAECLRVLPAGVKEVFTTAHGWEISSWVNKDIMTDARETQGCVVISST